MESLALHIAVGSSRGQYLLYFFQQLWLVWKKLGTGLTFKGLPGAAEHFFNGWIAFQDRQIPGDQENAIDKRREYILKQTVSLGGGQNYFEVLVFFGFRPPA